MRAELDLPPGRVEDVRSAALLHDIGKLDISRELLYKAARLTEEEFKHMQEHVNKGVSILEPVGGSLRRVIPIVLSHHDKFDGSGYNPTKGEDIPLEARIISVADVYDSLTSDRPYRKAMSPFDAKEIIVKGVGHRLRSERRRMRSWKRSARASSKFRRSSSRTSMSPLELLAPDTVEAIPFSVRLAERRLAGACARPRRADRRAHLRRNATDLEWLRARAADAAAPATTSGSSICRRAARCSKSTRRCGRASCSRSSCRARGSTPPFRSKCCAATSRRCAARPRSIAARVRSRI